jgi:hypothetical protein
MNRRNKLKHRAFTSTQQLEMCLLIISFFIGWFFLFGWAASHHFLFRFGVILYEIGITLWRGGDITNNEYFFPLTQHTTTLIFTTREWLVFASLARDQSRRFGVRNSVRIYMLDDRRVCDDLTVGGSAMYFLAGKNPERKSECRGWTVEEAEELSFLPRENLTYQSILLGRMTIIANLLDSGASVFVAGYLILDSDVALYRNIAARMTRLNADMVFQREIPCHESEYCVNGGVWWVSAHSEAARNVVHLALRYMRELNIPDQDALQHAIARTPDVDVMYLDPFRYPNGFMYNYESDLRRSRVHMIHFNWAPSPTAKLARLADVGVFREFPVYGALYKKIANLEADTRDTNRTWHRLDSDSFIVPRELPRVSEHVIQSALADVIPPQCRCETQNGNE